MTSKTENFLTKRMLINSSTYRDQIKVRLMMMADNEYINCFLMMEFNTNRCPTLAKKCQADGNLNGLILDLNQMTIQLIYF